MKILVSWKEKKRTWKNKLPKAQMTSVIIWAWCGWFVAVGMLVYVGVGVEVVMAGGDGVVVVVEVWGRGALLLIVVVTRKD